MKRRLPTLVVLVVLLSGPALAQTENAVHECDRLASSPEDVTRPDGIPGVPFDKLDPAPAIPVCERALEQQPDNPRYQFQLARSLHIAKRYAEALGLYLRPAEQGHPGAQNNLGLLYENGRSVETDYEVAAKWYRLAAVQGSATGQVNLGRMYKNGRGVLQDYAEAVKWYRKASEQGYELARRNLKLMYRDGPSDEKQAVDWYSEGARRGNTDAQYNLGLLYLRGQGVPRDNVLALMWFNIATSHGSEKSSHYQNITVQRMTPDQTAEARRMARKWMEAHPR